MNGSVYISFFQGQLEPVLEQVVQLAVQEISKTVGSSLNSMLLETAVKEQENKQLKLQLQSRESGGGGGGALDNGYPMPTSKAGKAADGAGSGRTKLEPLQDSHAPVHCTARGLPADTRRLEQKGRVVGQLKGVMERVLDFAVCELTKIVEASFDDLLLEITKKEREQKALEEYLVRSTASGGGGGGGGGGAPGDRGSRGASRRRGSKHHSSSPSGSEDTREELADVIVSKETPGANDPERPAVLSMSHDWVPILDKVFGQKWCSDVWQVKELEVVRGKPPGEGCPRPVASPFDLAPVDMEPSPTSPQQDPRWTPLEDMEVLSPEDNKTPKGLERAVSPAESLHRRSSASMLQRLLTLPAQLVDDDDDCGGGECEASNSASITAADILDALAPEGGGGGGGGGRRHDGELRGIFSLATKQGEQQQQKQQQAVVEEEEEEEEEDKGRKKRRRVWLECDECGRRFSRASLLKTHRQTHAADNAAAASAAAAEEEEEDGERPASPGGAGEDQRPAAALTVLRCPECRKHFSSASRLQSHVQNQHRNHHHHPHPHQPHPGKRT